MSSKLKVYLAGLAILGTMAARGQSVGRLKDVANDYFEAERYAEAAELYEKVIGLSPSDDESRYRQAFSYYKITQYDEAEPRFARLSKTAGPFQPLSIYYYGFLVKIRGDFKRADSVFTAFLGLDRPEQKDLTDLVKFQKAGCELGMRLQRSNFRYPLTEMTGLNSEYNDFGAVEWPGRNSVVLSTTRKLGGRQYADPKYGGYLPGIISFRNEGSEWRQTNDFDKLNTRWSQGTGSFTGDGTKFFFSTCNKASPCKIYVSEWLNGSWSEPTALDSIVNQPGTDSKQPFITASADTLFFSSNRPGGKGGLDLWMSLRVDDSQWGPAINLGENINTPADEISPYYSPTHFSLLFASNGHAGYGGYDLYLAKGVSFFEPQIYNLGPPLNSTLDDLYPYLGEKGYLASNRNGSGFDLFQFDVGSHKSFFQYILSSDAVIDVEYHTIASLDLYAFRLDDYEGYEIFQPLSGTSALPQKQRRGYVNIYGQQAPPAGVVRLSIDKKTEILTLAKASGDFAFRLSPDTIAGKYTVLGDGIHNPPLTEADTLGDFYQYPYEKVYFDYGSSVLRKESMESLNDLVRQFHQSNVVLIDIQTHSDSRGNAEYNKVLSEKRGISIMRYLKSLGISEVKMRTFAFGEEDPISASDSWYARFFNRRAEIIIYTESPVTYAKPEIYLVMRDLSLKNVADNLGLNEQRIMEWNGVTSGQVKEGSTVRVFDPDHRSPSMRNLISQQDIDYNFFPYVVKPGESLRTIAEKFQTIEELILEINDLAGEVKPGDEIIVQM